MAGGKGFSAAVALGAAETVSATSTGRIGLAGCRSEGGLKAHVTPETFELY
jgi:hypothetical protein